ncbi:hypothetical protein CERZMDRAFT_117972 [Cercospora zeae-maydis SCOH1-5]|uniref:Uncharacterized protein n=1 Tax=Cercospora zeae-maydis SCOH1-5 TaxID=717836 RepID=A0A6A6FD65_9PEZI|nr:hypothetical protein CERZMDRAFT_117972 [Cercospora zeae-maydis SCOH1-5]
MTALHLTASGVYSISRASSRAGDAALPLLDVVQALTRRGWDLRESTRNTEGSGLSHQPSGSDAEISKSTLAVTQRVCSPSHSGLSIDSEAREACYSIKMHAVPALISNRGQTYKFEFTGLSASPSSPSTKTRGCLADLPAVRTEALGLSPTGASHATPHPACACM